MPFPTVFPAEAAAFVGQAILNRTGFTREMAEPLYDLQGFAEYKLLGIAPAPKPTFSSDRGADCFDYDEEQVGRMLADAGEAVYLAENAGGEVHFGLASDAKTALPWKSILKVILAILGGLLIEPKPGEDDTTEHPPA